MSLPPGLGAVYRLATGPQLGFFQAAESVPYLDALGVATIGVSPPFEAVAGSADGEEVTDPTHLRQELGGEVGFAALVLACESHRIGLCADVVPGQMSTHPGGPLWRRVLLAGRASAAAELFAIDWAAGGGRVVLPLLDRPLAEALQAGLIRYHERAGVPLVSVAGHELPVTGGDYRQDEDVTEVLAAQHYTLVPAVAGAANYRRPGGRNDLVAVRDEDPDVFARTHALVLQLARTGKVSALRVLRLDRLREPTAYLQRLAQACELPLIVDKLLAPGEELPAHWPVWGTTGAEVVDALGGALVDPEGLRRLVAAARAEGESDPGTLAVTARRLVAAHDCAPEIAESAAALGVAVSDLCETLVRLPLRRTYLSTGPLRPEDEEAWRATEDGGRRSSVVDAVLHPAGIPATLDLQPLANTLAEIGIDGIAAHRLVGAVAFCEPGGNPGADRERGVEQLAELARRRQGGMSPGTSLTGQHSEDVRCRLYALSELPDRFERGLARFREALGLRTNGGELGAETRYLAAALLALSPALSEAGRGHGAEAPAPHDEALSLRLHAALVARARAARLRSSLARPDTHYEALLYSFADAALERHGALVRTCFGALVDEVARLGACNSLGTLVLRSALPGAPELLAGDEIWNLCLGGADAHQRIATGRLVETLGGVAGAGSGPEDVAELRRSWRDGRVKLLVAARALAARRSAARSFEAGVSCVTLPAQGAASGRALLALARCGGDDGWVIAVATRHASRLPAHADDLPSGPAYAGMSLPLPPEAPRRFVEVLGGRKVAVDSGALRVEEVLEDLPVALLLSLDHGVGARRGR